MFFISPSLFFVFRWLEVTGHDPQETDMTRVTKRENAWTHSTITLKYLDMFLYVNNIHIDILNDGNNQEAIYRTIRLLYNLYDNDTIFVKRSIREFRLGIENITWYFFYICLFICENLLDI